MKIVIIILFIILAFVIISCQKTSDHKDITGWVVSRSETVKEIDRRFMDIGPYWAMKDARYYRVETDKGVYWFKYLFGRTIKAEKNDGGYTELE